MLLPRRTNGHDDPSKSRGLNTAETLSLQQQPGAQIVWSVPASASQMWAAGRCGRSKSFGDDPFVVVDGEGGFAHGQRAKPGADGPSESGRPHDASAVGGAPWASQMGVGQQLEAKKPKMSLFGGSPTL
jgi:hypothetical protein